MTCRVSHPEFPEVYCNQTGAHPHHSGRRDFSDHDGRKRPQYLDWPNGDYVEPPGRAGSHQQALKELAGQVPPARSEDVPTVGQAAGNHRIRRTTRKGMVAQYLLDHVGEWIPATHFTHEDVGGFAGTRRLRELREDHNWPIETRSRPDASNIWEHRLIRIPSGEGGR